MGAKAYLRREAIGGRQDAVRLQHPEGIHAPSCSQAEGWNADLREDADRQDNYPRGRAFSTSSHRSKTSCYKTCPGHFVRPIQSTLPPPSYISFFVYSFHSYCMHQM